MKKLLAAGALGLLLAGGSLTAAIAAPGPNGHNNHGLCTAYFNGSDTGRAHKHQAGPFQALQQMADDGNNDTSPEQDVWNWCNDATNNPKGIGGNPTPPSQ